MSRTRATDRQASVYVMEARDGLVKIGASRSIDLRVKALSSVRRMPVRLVWVSEPRNNARCVEYTAHTMLEHASVGGEWFSIPAQEAVATVTEASIRVDSGDLSDNRRLPHARSKVRIGRQVAILVRTSFKIKKAAEAAAAAERRSLSKWIETLILAALENKK